MSGSLLPHKQYESSDSFRDAFHSSPVGMLITRISDGLIIDVNKTFCDIIGYDCPEIVGKTTEEINFWVNADDRKHFVETLKTNGHVKNLETRFRRRSGDIGIMISSVQAIQIQDTPCFISSAVDITDRKAQENELKRTHQLLGLAQQCANAGIWYWDLSTGKTTWTKELFELFGLDPAASDANFDNWRHVVHPDDREIAETRIFDAVKQGIKLASQYRILLPTGEMRWIEAIGDVIQDEHGLERYQTGICLDVTERKSNELKLREKDTQFREAIETSIDGFLMLDQLGHIIEVNAAYITLSGYSREELLTMSITDLEALETQEQTLLHVQKIIQNRHDRFESMHLTKDGRTWPIEVAASYSPIFGGLFYSFIKDLTEKKKSENQIWHQANFDPLTDLPNRLLFYDRLSMALSQARRNKKHIGLIFLDLDGFKPVNDEHGHESGDFVLKTITKRWLSCVRKTDSIARLGGDEFAVIVGELDHPQEAGTMASKLIEALSANILLPNGKQCRLSVSAGIGIYPDNATEIDSLLTASDAAMYECKTAGKNGYVFSKAVSDENSLLGEWIQLNDSHYVGVDEIDDQHLQLIKLVNRLNEVVKTNNEDVQFDQLFDELIDYTVFHFETETRLMERFHYPGLGEHELEHQRLLQEVQYYKKRSHKGMEHLALKKIKDWLLDHIEYADKPLGVFISKTINSQNDQPSV